MIQKKFRLKRPEIEFLLRKGKELATDLFIVRFATSTEQIARFTVIASSRLSKKAVDRNRIKRQIYEAIRINMVDSATNTVIIPKKRALKSTYKEIESNIKQIISWIKKES